MSSRDPVAQGSDGREGGRTLSPNQVAPKELAEDTQAGSQGTGPIEVIVGEIPVADDPTTMVWTVRCSVRAHDLLGHFDTRGDAEQVRTDHVRVHEEDRGN